jgi:hypothetical protein
MNSKAKLEAGKHQKIQSGWTLSKNDKQQLFSSQDIPTNTKKDLFNGPTGLDSCFDFSRIPTHGILSSRELQQETFPMVSGANPFWAAGYAFPSGVQKKLTVNKPGDEYEQEADRVAESVMRMSGLQETVERKPISEQISPIVNSRETNAIVPFVSSQTSNQIDSSRGSGTRLSLATASWMSERMGTDFSDVRVHTDSQAVQISRDLGAQAFTIGKDVYFGAGKYDIGSVEGKRLLAHELTHVVQQSCGASSRRINREGNDKKPSSKINSRELLSIEILIKIRLFMNLSDSTIVVQQSRRFRPNYLY